MKGKEKRAIRALGFILAGVLALPLPVAAQDQPMGHYTATAGTEYVSLPVIVRDKKGRFVDDVRKDDFHVFVDGQPVAIDSFEENNSAPVSFAILLDVSGSMRIADKLDRAKEMIQRLVGFGKKATISPFFRSRRPRSGSSPSSAPTLRSSCGSFSP